MATEGQFPKTDGDVLYASEVNIFFQRPIEIYTGSDLNFHISGANAFTGSYIFNHIPASTISPGSYIEFNCIGSVHTQGTSNNYGRVGLSILTSLSGTSLSFSESTPSTLNFSSPVSSAVHDNAIRGCQTFTWIHTLSADERDQGLYLMTKISGTSVDNASQAAFKNIQTYIKPL